MNILLTMAFVLMIPPAFISLAIAARSVPAMIWNFSWFLIFAKVGTLAFNSPYGGVPGIALGLLYTIKLLKPRPKSNLMNMETVLKVFQQQMNQQKRGSTQNHHRTEPGDVVEAEFRREDDKNQKRLN